MPNNNKKYRCIGCDYETNDPANWFHHKKTLKHKNNNKSVTTGKYYCNVCKYDANSLSNLLNHKKTKKHIGLCEKNKNVKNKILCICDYCKKKFKHLSSLYRHKKTCEMIKNKNLIDNLTTNEKIYKIQVKEKDENVQFLKHIVDKKTDMLFGANKIMKNMSVLKFLSSHINSAPPLEYFKKERIEEIINEGPIIKNNMIKYPDEKDNHFPEHIIYTNNHGVLLEYLSGLIVEEYKKKDPTKQAMWISDVPRIVFTVTKKSKKKKDENQDNNDDNSEDNNIDNISETDSVSVFEAEWIYDKNGLYVRELIIDPLLDYVLEKLKLYIDRSNEWIKNNWDSPYRDLKQDKISKALDIVSDIKGKSIHRKLVRAIAPKFHMSNDIMKRLVFCDINSIE